MIAWERRTQAITVCWPIRKLRAYLIRVFKQQFSVFFKIRVGWKICENIYNVFKGHKNLPNLPFYFLSFRFFQSIWSLKWTFLSKIATKNCWLIATLDKSCWFIPIDMDKVVFVAKSGGKATSPCGGKKLFEP